MTSTLGDSVIQHGSTGKVRTNPLQSIRPRSGVGFAGRFLTDVANCAAAADVGTVHIISATAVMRSRGRCTSYKWTVNRGRPPGLDDGYGWRRPPFFRLVWWPWRPSSSLPAGPFASSTRVSRARIGRSASGRGPSTSAKMSSCSGGPTTWTPPKTPVAPVTPTIPSRYSASGFTVCWSVSSPFRF